MTEQENAIFVIQALPHKIWEQMGLEEKKAIDMGIEALAKQMESVWTPVSEGLPNSDCDILCFVEMKRRDSECTFRRIVKWDCKYKYWKYENGAYVADYYKVIAWQRLVYPEPYKVGDNNE